tara:strand:- start:409 stop:666 length:258 start_codon:yes stop_codon:yes gene_type:complete
MKTEINIQSLATFCIVISPLEDSEERTTTLRRKGEEFIIQTTQPNGSGNFNMTYHEKVTRQSDPEYFADLIKVMINCSEGGKYYK